jgi:hypothetical protein
MPTAARNQSHLGGVSLRRCNSTALKKLFPLTNVTSGDELKKNGCWDEKARLALVLRLRPLRRAAWVFLLSAWLGLCTGLSGRPGLAAGNAEMPVTGPDPSYQGVVATHLRQVLKNYSAYDSFEISDPRWVHSIKGWTWLTCVRFRDQGRVRSYALFLDGNKIVDDRFAVQTDSCDLQTYYPFERMWRRPADRLFFPRKGAARRGHDQPALPAASKRDT